MFPSEFKGDFVTPNDSDYPKAIARWAANAERKAKVVAFVKDAQDVAIALKYARAHNLPIAVRGGGHSSAGASSIEDGLVIDLSRHLSGCRVDADKKLVFIGGGAVWETVDKAAIQHGLASVGGTVNHTGVAGLTLGGGYGYLTGAHGMVMDNLEQATIVTADGSILTASNKENQDLFFAIRGGGSNFGVATELVLRLHTQRRTVFAGNLFFPASEELLDKLIPMTAEFRKRQTGNEYIAEIMTLDPHNRPCIIMTLFHNGSESEGRAVYKDFFTLGHVLDTTKERPYEELNGLLNDVMYHGQNIYLSTTSQKAPNLNVAKSILQKVIKLAEETNIIPGLLFEYYNTDKMMSIPNSATPFRREPTTTVGFMFRWPGDQDKPGNTETCRETVKKWVELIRAGDPTITESQSLGYSNVDADAVRNDSKARLVWGEHYDKMQQIKKKYDPGMVFNRWFPITPAA